MHLTHATEETTEPAAKPKATRPRLDLPRFRRDLAAVVTDIVETKNLLRASGQPGVGAATWRRLIVGKAKADALCMLRAHSRGRLHHGTEHRMDAAMQAELVKELAAEYAKPASETAPSS